MLKDLSLTFANPFQAHSSYLDYFTLCVKIKHSQSFCGNFSKIWTDFCARQHMLSAHMLSQFRLSVRLSVRHTGDSCKNG